MTHSREKGRGSVPVWFLLLCFYYRHFFFPLMSWVRRHPHPCHPILFPEVPCPLLSRAVFQLVNKYILSIRCVHIKPWNVVYCTKNSSVFRLHPESRCTQLAVSFIWICLTQFRIMCVFYRLKPHLTIGQGIWYLLPKLLWCRANQGKSQSYQMRTLG